MLNIKTKTIATLISLVLIIGMAIPLLAIQPAKAEVINGINYGAPTATAIKAGMNFIGQSYNASDTRLLLWNRWKDKIPTWVYVVPSPNPVGVGQEASFIMMNPQLPWGSEPTSGPRYQYSLEILQPDGTILKLPGAGAGGGIYTQSVVNGRYQSDSTGTAYTLWTPTQVGNHSVTITFHELFYFWNTSTANRDYWGVTYLESKRTTELVVQQDPIEAQGWVDVPLPTEYWHRPIEGQNTLWYQISSNWYNNAFDRNRDGGSNALQPDGVGPNSPHILWTKTTEDGGVVGGNLFSVQGEVYNAGHQYQTRMDGNTIIMNGKMYYLGPRYFNGDGDIYRAVDLRTGYTIWEKNITGVGAPTFGYMYDMDTMNQHGITPPGLLFTNNFARAYHPLYGDVTSLNVTGVPSGFELAGPKGETLRLVLNSAGWLGQWNSSRVLLSGDMGVNLGFVNASVGSAYDWNVSAPWRVGMTGGSITIRGAILGDVMLGSNGTHATGTGAVTYHIPAEFTVWAINLNVTRGPIGQLLYMKNIQTAGFPDNHVVQFRKVGEGIFTMIELPYQLPIAYDLYTGNLKWKAEKPIADFNPFGYYGYASLINVYYDKIGYGKWFVSGYSGMVHAYDVNDGKLLWTYTAPTGRTVFKYYTLFMGVLADNKMYIGTHEHSADTPLFKGQRIRALNISNGAELWTMYGWAYPGTMAVADGTLVYWSNYDHQIYALAKGPSAMTVEAPMAGVTLNSNVVIRGTVTDISAGTTQNEQAMRFPNGVPAVSDASQSAWMEYVYMQKARPMDTTGVPVTISVVDANGNYREIGTTASNDGFFALNWKPDIAGQYTVYAAFAGSESYWPSHAVTSFAVDAAAATPAPTAQPIQSTADQYIVPATVGIIAAIVVVGLLIILVLRKRP